MAKDQNSEAAKKVADAEKASKKKSAKNDGKPNIVVRAAKAVAKFFKDLKGENKKIVWPNAKTVLKNTGIVLVVVLIVGVPIVLVDFGLSEGINALLGIEAPSTVVSEEATTANSAVKPTAPTTKAPSATSAATTDAATTAASTEAATTGATTEAATTAQ